MEIHMSDCRIVVALKVVCQNWPLPGWYFSLLLVVLLAFPAAGSATVTIRNFDGNGTAVANQITPFDVDGNAIDAHDGGIYQFGGKFYRYGTSYGCGFRWLTAGSFCGFKVYSSLDLVNWSDEGFLFDASDPAWQSRCNGSTNGCFRPHVVFNAATNTFVLWFNAPSTSPQYWTLVSSTPTGPFTDPRQPTGLSAVGGGDFNLFLDDDGHAYSVYTNGGDGFREYVQMLDGSFRNGTGSATYLGDTDDEAPALFKRGSTYYAIYGRTCAFCGGTDTYYRSASSPLGTWSAESRLSAGTCGGQPTMVSPLSINGSTIYLFQADLWRSLTADRQGGWPNQGLATQFWLPLGFNGTAINSITCDASFNVELTASTPPPEAGVDQTTEGNSFGTHCGINDIGSDYTRLQTFTLSRSGTLRTILFTIAQGNYFCAVGSCPGVDADFTLDLVTFDQNTSMVTGVLGSAIFSRTTMPWSPVVIEATMGVPVMAGTTYGIRVSSPANGCYAWNHAGQSIYPAGKEAYSFRGGAYVFESTATKFSVILDAVPDTTITSSPAALTKDTAASFRFTSTVSGSTFTCSLDSASFSPCSSPALYAGLANGPHTFQVRAADPYGNTDPTPATYNWTIDTVPPETTITSGPPSPTTSTTASFSFTSSEAGSFTCSLDAGAASSCTSPKPYSGLSAGSHTFRAAATDIVGNTDPTPATYTWTIQLTAPDTTITSTNTNRTTAVFKFTSTTAGSTFACALDGRPFQTCTSPQNYTGLAPGTHAFSVYAIDKQGNADPTPANFTWTASK